MSDDLFAAVHARPKRHQGITGQTIDAQMRGTICQITEWELEELSDEIARLRAEVEMLTIALADERRHADALADTLYTMDGLQKVDCEMRDNAVQQHRARRST